MIGGIHKWLIPCNWKFPAENFSGDRYHGMSHRSVDMVGIGPSGKGRRDMQERNEARWLDVSFPELGHSMIAFLRKHDAPLAPGLPGRAGGGRVLPALRGGPPAPARRVLAAVRRARHDVPQHLAAGAAAAHAGGAGTRAGPHQTEVWRWYLVDADAPAEVKDFLRHYYIRYSGPSGLTEQDDMENWNYAHKASRGTIARQYPYNYEMGLGRATRDFEDHGLKLPGTIIDVTAANASENNQRGFYSRWRQFMEAASWKDWRPVSAEATSRGSSSGGGRGVPVPARPSCWTSAGTRSGWRSSPRTPITSCRCAATSRATSPSASSRGRAPTSTGSTRARTR